MDLLTSPRLYAYTGGRPFDDRVPLLAEHLQAGEVGLAVWKDSPRDRGLGRALSRKTRTFSARRSGA